MNLLLIKHNQFQNNIKTVFLSLISLSIDLDFLKTRSEDNEMMDTINAIHTGEVCLSDCSIGSCLHMVHYSCYCDFIEGNNTFGKNHYQFCPVCRRLESGFFPLLCPITINQTLRSTYLPQPLFNPDNIHPTQWNDLQKMNESSILSYYYVYYYLMIIIYRIYGRRRN